MKKIISIIIICLTLTSCEWEDLFEEDEKSCLSYDNVNYLSNSGELYVGNTYKIEYVITNSCKVPFTILDIQKEENQNIFFIEGLQKNKKIEAETTFYLVFKPQKSGLNTFSFTIITDLQSNSFGYNINVN